MFPMPTYTFPVHTEERLSKADFSRHKDWLSHDGDETVDVYKSVYFQAMVLCVYSLCFFVYGHLCLTSITTHQLRIPL